MKKALFFIISFFFIFMALTSDAKDISNKEKQDKTKAQMPLNIRVKPNVLEFNCNFERVKKLMVTNISKQVIQIKANPQQSWISVEPGFFRDVAGGSTVTFNVSVNCEALNGTRANKGTLIVSGDDKGLVIKVIALKRQR